VTADASTAGGATDRCKDNLKAAWWKILQAGRTTEGRELLTASFRTCSPVQAPAAGRDDPYALIQWAQEPWATLAMGNYPYASSYLMHGESILPAWPVRAACKHLSRAPASDAELFEGVREAVAVYYNNTGSQKCFNVTGASRQRGMGGRLGATKAVADSPQQCQGSWDYQWCTEMTQPFTQGTGKDLYYCPNGTYYAKQNCSHWDFPSLAVGCEARWGVRPRKEWASTALASKRLPTASNIVFSNGLQDPWHPGGVLENISDTVVAVVIPNGAHHIDLMFSDPEDAAYPDIGHARAVEVVHMRKWVGQPARVLV